MNKVSRNLMILVTVMMVVIYLCSFSTTVFPPGPLPSNSIELGEILFSEPLLSSTKKVSCASCHNPSLAFTDSATFSLGVNGHLTTRNTPSVIYLEANKIFFWDGRANSLEMQALGPLTNKNEMGMTMKEAIKRLVASPFYLQAFNNVFGRKPDSLLLLKSLADYEKSLSVYDAPYDRFLKGDETVMSEAALRGFRLFFRENSCANPACHAGISFSSDSLVNIGIYDETDMGLYNLTKNKEDIGKFKSASLRNITVTAPYMHNGKHKTLREVIDYYNEDKNFPPDGNTHAEVKTQRARKMTATQINDMIEFLKTLTDYRYMKDVEKKVVIK